MLQWYGYCFKKFFTFKGRASRAEYWTFTIINLLIFTAFWMVSSVVDAPVPGTPSGDAALPRYPVLSLIFGSAYLLFYLAIFFPTLSVTIRRLHDRNHTGFWILACMIPILNLVVLIFLLLPSQPFANYYGLRAPRSPSDNVPDIVPNVYGPYGEVVYENTPRSNQTYQPEGTESMTKTQECAQETAQRGSVMDEMAENKHQQSPASKSETHRPMQAEESGIVARMKKLSQK